MIPVPHTQLSLSLFHPLSAPIVQWSVINNSDKMSALKSAPNSQNNLRSAVFLLLAVASSVECRPAHRLTLHNLHGCILPIIKTPWCPPHHGCWHVAWILNTVRFPPCCNTSGRPKRPLSTAWIHRHDSRDERTPLAGTIGCKINTPAAEPNRSWY